MKRNIIKDETLTFAEKITNLKSAKEEIQKAGEIAVVNADLALAQDSTGPLAIKIFDELGLRKVWDPKKIFIFLDHTYPAADEKVANLHNMVRLFGEKYKVNVVEGSISHQYMMENHVVPGCILIGADSHTNQAGALGSFATAVGSSEMVSIWSTGRIWITIPETIRIRLEGSLKKGVYARDIIMSVIGELGEDGANYKSLEWDGVKSLSIDSRACICNNSIECGATNSVFEYDSVTENYMKEAGRTGMEVHSGKKAEIYDEIKIELDKLEPKVTLPEHVDRVADISRAVGVEIDQGFIGSTTNCRIEDLEVAARILKGRKVKQGTRLVITPASKKVYWEAWKKGFVSIFLDSGAVFTNSTCGACVGTHMGVLGESEVCISCSPRNYSGRMGALSAKVYLASPAVVAASVIEGKIADPRKYL